MSVRQTLNQNPAIAAGAAAVVVLGAAVLVYFSLRTTPTTALETGTRRYFTDDDGKTFFPDYESNVPPFVKNGKPVYGAVVGTCGGKKVVIYLEKFTDQAKQVLAATKEGVDDRP